MCRRPALHRQGQLTCSQASHQSATLLPACLVCGAARQRSRRLQHPVSIDCAPAPLCMAVSSRLRPVLLCSRVTLNTSHLLSGRLRSLGSREWRINAAQPAGLIPAEIAQPAEPDSAPQSPVAAAADGLSSAAGSTTGSSTMSSPAVPGAGSAAHSPAASSSAGSSLCVSLEQSPRDVRPIGLAVQAIPRYGKRLVSSQRLVWKATAMLVLIPASQLTTATCWQVRQEGPTPSPEVRREAASPPDSADSPGEAPLR